MELSLSYNILLFRTYVKGDRLHFNGQNPPGFRNTPTRYFSDFIIKIISFMRQVCAGLLLLLLSTFAYGQSGQLELSANGQFDLGWGLKIANQNYFTERLAFVAGGRMHRYSFYADGRPQEDNDTNVLRPPHDSLDVPYRYQEVSTSLGIRFDILRNERFMFYAQPNIALSMMDLRNPGAYLSDLGMDFTGQLGMMVPIAEGFNFQAELGLRYKGALYQAYGSSYVLTTLSAGITYNLTGFGGVSSGVFCPLADKGLMNLPNKEQAFLLEVPITTQGEIGYGGRITSYTRVYRAFYLSTLIRGSQLEISTDNPNVNPIQRELAGGIGLRWDFIRNEKLRLYLNPTVEFGIFRVFYPYPRAQQSKGHVATTPSLGLATSARSKVRFMAELGFRYRFIPQDFPEWRKSFVVLSAGIAININD